MITVGVFVCLFYKNPLPQAHTYTEYVDKNGHAPDF